MPCMVYYLQVAKDVHSLCRNSSSPHLHTVSPSSDPCTVQEVARLAEEINTSLDNIGARRLHTVLERILEQISFDAPDKVRACLACR